MAESISSAYRQLQKFYGQLAGKTREISTSWCSTENGWMSARVSSDQRGAMTYFSASTYNDTGHFKSESCYAVSVANRFVVICRADGKGRLGPDYVETDSETTSRRTKGGPQQSHIITAQSGYRIFTVDTLKAAAQNIGAQVQCTAP